MKLRKGVVLTVLDDGKNSLQGEKYKSYYFILTHVERLEV